MKPAGYRGWAAAAVAIALVAGLARPAFSADDLSLPPTSFTILNPDTGVAIGRSIYRVDSAGNGATLNGVNRYSDRQVDVEVAHVESGAPGHGPKLVDFDHIFYNADGSILVRGYLDLKSGAATCINNSAGQKIDLHDVLSIPQDTWAGASVVIPVQDFLRAGDGGKTRSLHVFNCAPGPKIFAVSVNIDAQNAVWNAYGAEARRVEIRPDFGLINPILTRFVPTIHAWFDPVDRWALVGDEAARWYTGQRVMLVKTRDGAGAPPQSK